VIQIPAAPLSVRRICQSGGSAPPVGFEPTLTAPEAVALSPELWGLRDVGKSTSERPLPGHAAIQCAITGQKTLPSRE
jgi:hypothetical protein